MTDRKESWTSQVSLVLDSVGFWQLLPFLWLLSCWHKKVAQVDCEAGHLKLI